MNVYFVVEGKTERKVYPKWLSYLVPKLERIYFPSDATGNNYYLIGGFGYPLILEELKDAISNINSTGNYNFLVLAIDTDNLTVDERIEEVNDFIAENGLQLDKCKLLIIPQVVCIETWFLGNRHIYSRNPSAEFIGFSRHYDVSQNDPEKMAKPVKYSGSIGNYHYDYLRAMLGEKDISYTKKYPRAVTEPYYIDGLQNRVNSDRDCLKSMQNLIGFFHSVAQET